MAEETTYTKISLSKRNIQWAQTSTNPQYVSMNQSSQVLNNLAKPAQKLQTKLLNPDRGTGHHRIESLVPFL